MDLELAGKAVIVGGASQGIGLAVARRLALEGAQVAMFARRKPELQSAADGIRADGGTVLAVPADLRVAPDIERVVEEAADVFGRLDAVVNNDGAPPLGALEEFDDEAWSAAVDRNLMSVVRMARAAVPHMRRAGGGSVVNVTALSVLQPIERFGLSTATWAAVVSFAKTLSRELGPDGIRVNTVCPGRIDTERAAAFGRATGEPLPPDIPLRRLGRPEEVGDVIAFLCSARSSYVTGATLQVDGGRRAALL